VTADNYMRCHPDFINVTHLNPFHFVTVRPGLAPTPATGLLAPGGGMPYPPPAYPPAMPAPSLSSPAYPTAVPAPSASPPVVVHTQDVKQDTGRGINFATPNQVELHNTSNALVALKYSGGTVVLSPGQSTRVTVVLKQENFAILDKDRNILGGVPVQADAMMRCHPSYICWTPEGQVVTR